MASKPLRILHLSSEYPPVIGGVATHVHQLASAMEKIGHQVQVITTSRMEGEELFPKPPVYRPSVPHSRLFYTAFLKHYLRKFLKTQPADIVHVHGMRPIEASKGLDIPVVFTNHTSGFLKRIEKGGARRMKNLAWRFEHMPLILAPSDELIEASLKTGYQGNTQFVSNGVDTDVFYPSTDERQQQRQRWGVKDSDTVILLARRLASKNGVVDFAKAAVHLAKPGIRIVIAGDGAEKAAMEAEFAKQGHLESPIFMGSVINSEMPNIYRGADICVLPSHYEATSITGLEAMSTALPLVGTNVGGIPTLVADGETGLLVEAHHPDQLGKVLAELAENKEKIQTLGRAARVRVIEKFSWRIIAEQTIAAYREQALGR